MMTNLIASVVVCLVTNTTEHFPQHQVSDPVPMGPNGECYAVYRCHWEDDKNPTNKILTVEIKEVSVALFDFMGEPKVVKHEVLISSTSKSFVLNSGWREITETNLSYWLPSQLPFGRRFSP